MIMNRENFDLYHMRTNFSHKNAGQSQEVLSLQAMAVESTASFFQQAIVDIGDWFGVEGKNRKYENLLKIKPSEIHALLLRQLEKSEFFSHVGLGIKAGLLGALMITKVHGHYVNRPKYITKKDKERGPIVVQVEDKVWELKLDLVRQENYYPDPTESNLYEIEDMWMDLWQVKQLSQGDNAIFDPEIVDQIHHGDADLTDEQIKLSRETNQNQTARNHRARIKLTEYWGNILDDKGNLVYENCVCTIANDKWLIRKPSPNPYWHQQSPYVRAGLLDVPHAVWPKALMDAPTKHNIAANEVYNLMLDGGMRAVNDIAQIRVDWLDDPSQVEGGIPAGTKLKVNSQCPPGAKVMESVNSGSIPPDGMNIYNIINQEFNRAALTSDIRQGVMPFRQVKATEVVESSQTITSVFQGVAKNVEAKWVQPILEKSWMLAAQKMDDMDEDEVMGLIGYDRAQAIDQMSSQERFTETVNGIKFRVFGITLTLNKAQDFRKLTSLLQTIGASEVLIEEFTKKYDFGELLEELIRSLGIDTNKLELSPAVKATMQGQQPLQPGAAQPGASPNQMSQVPQASAGNLADILGQPQFPQANFPPSKASGA